MTDLQRRIEAKDYQLRMYRLLAQRVTDGPLRAEFDAVGKAYNGDTGESVELFHDSPEYKAWVERTNTRIAAINKSTRELIADEGRRIRAAERSLFPTSRDAGNTWTKTP